LRFARLILHTGKIYKAVPVHDFLEIDDPLAKKLCLARTTPFAFCCKASVIGQFFPPNNVASRRRCPPQGEQTGMTHRQVA
jgi:hypothetical protein